MFQSFIVIVALALSSAVIQEPVKDTMAGVTNLARVETTGRVFGAIDPAVAVPQIKKAGFASVINLREATENGAELEKEQALVEQAGLKYFHVPVQQQPAGGPKPLTRFLIAIATPGAEPAFIHCAGGNRAATMWLIKRLVIDRWDTDRAIKEATGLGQTSAALRQFAFGLRGDAQTLSGR
jgi:uncharacterized protein (TIGR01244 family)